MSVMSLQPVDEAVTAIEGLYIYIYIGVIFVIILLSLVYSKMISKPLIKLKKSASRMSEMDFASRCEINTEDEIGDLARILNFLSRELGVTLTELKDANKKLEEDIKKERQLEVMRKEFIAGVSHELKTPISLISGYAEALKDNIVYEKDRDMFLHVILDESKNMGSLVGICLTCPSWKMAASGLILKHLIW